MSRALLSFPALRSVTAPFPVVTFGVVAIDAAIGGGLAAASLHEFYAATPEDGSAASAFTLMMAMRAGFGNKPIVWLREQKGVRAGGRLCAAGLVDLGFDPDALVLIEAPDTLAVLRAGADSVKCGAIGAVVIEPWGKAPSLDLTASRRLALAAAASGVLTLVLRIDAVPVPSAARTRWQIAAAPSSALAANAPGHPAFDIMLLRHRGGIAGIEARLEWNRDTGSFAPLSRGASAIAAVGADPAQPIVQSRAA